jgi:SAM-dependent methyltransferase
MECLYCTSSRLVPLYAGVRDRLGYVPGTRAFARCTDCGSAVLTPLPRAEELADFYPPVYSFSLEFQRQPWYKRWLAALEYHLFFRPQYRSQVQTVLQAVGRHPRGRRLLDVGCGRGLRLLEFRQAGFDVHGLDLQTDVVRYLRDELHIPADCGDIGAMPRLFGPAAFDVVTAFFLLEHVPDVRAVLADCFRVLRPGGWLAAAVPLHDCAQARYFGKDWINVTEAPRHLSLPTQAGMIHACKQVGYDRVVIRGDSVLNCAGQVGSSALPGGTLTHVYGGTALWAYAKRLLGAVVTLAAVPACFIENECLHRISLGIVLARKPGGAHATA